jgi:DNA-binding MarR family transcriptional regulator
MVLEWNPRVSQRSIADSLGQTEASVSRQIKVLQRDGLLVSKPDPENRRRHITAPTPKGMQLTESANAILRRHFGPDLGTLDDEQLTQLMRSLQKLHNTVCNHPLGL